ncbi:MAG: 16S rRNA (adenine(1518)-N(6)/adenine(1519)-N(6))-dimethyltransferase RsmA [Patescibacteria group bacterium]|nr:ribosomal RNA small subunit methyltransferase A [Patescibacteria group bacterium]MBU1421196.1 ribosomal RNA small subunit methyltransferase A [Patescibacteria group bacterium]MBU1778635.1 ribosomal RNA small subunit methyltransferase A [Patescibacteria group bacterium]MBU2456299.1 ribosomal RNA small subunit methyltransferase A [Patescibacteria group bacterium]
MRYEVQRLCELYNIKPSRSKGQNFLVSKDVYDKIIKTADLNKNDIVLEVGPGFGFLTVALAKKVKKVIAVELDDKLSQALRERLVEQEMGNVEVINDDILKFSIFSAATDSNNFQFSIFNYKIIANLPYNITSIFLRKFLSAEIKPSLMVLMLQKEVAERIIAKPPKMSLLAVSVQFYAKPKIIDMVSSSNFWPEPKVNSAVIQLTIINYQLAINEERFFRLVKIGFSSKRKMLKNNLAGGYKISQQEAERKLIKVGFNPKIRAQELSVDDWKKLLNVV